MGTKLPFCIHVPATCVDLRRVSKDATAGAIGAAMWFGVPVSIREI